MYVTMMMTDQIPLELPPLLNGEVAMMPHLVNGDAAQQVCVNPLWLLEQSFQVLAPGQQVRCCENDNFIRRPCCVLYFTYLSQLLSSNCVIS
ncbi:hypothetical protein FD755_014290 [Muntiacus reevesi]|uniref:Uncharacterized protein n=1 Tax=Muntiacus reevesi TaxID=9886 RepID=A0A5N3XJV7_MUNRE|nr:hypothetical protein FD755_014290 [Muntiacus reevesi]